MHRESVEPVRRDADVTPLPIATLRVVSDHGFPPLELPEVSGVVTPRVNLGSCPATPIDESFEEHEPTLPSARPPAHPYIETIMADAPRSLPPPSAVIQVPARPIYALLGAIVVLLLCVVLLLLSRT